MIRSRILCHQKLLTLFLHRSRKHIFGHSSVGYGMFSLLLCHNTNTVVFFRAFLFWVGGGDYPGWLLLQASTTTSMSSVDGMIGVSTETGGKVFDPLGLAELHAINPLVNPHPKVRGYDLVAAYCCSVCNGMSGELF